MTVNGNVITADENKMLVKGDIRSTQVILGEADRAENWAEDPMTEDEKSDQRAETERIVSQKIAGLKEQLSATDYKAIKYAEGWLSDGEYAPVKAERQLFREQINRLEETLTYHA